MNARVLNKPTLSKQVSVPSVAVNSLMWLWQQYCQMIAWNDRARSRVALSKLDARLLKDAGITEQAANAEMAKPFWKN
ncbi:MAG: DUF1127 domain-containing protein [Arenicellales bacterium]